MDSPEKKQCNNLVQIFSDTGLERQKTEIDHTQKTKWRKDEIVENVRGKSGPCFISSRFCILRCQGRTR